MKVNVVYEGKTAIVAPGEKIDFVTAPEFEKVIEEHTEKADDIVIDMKDVDYISSAGLRVILYADNIMSEKGGLKLRNVCGNVKEVLDISGFSKIVNIE